MPLGIDRAVAALAVRRVLAPLDDRRAKIFSAGMSSPMVIITRGPIHIIAEIEEIRPMQIMPPTTRPPNSPKMWVPEIRATSRWPASLSIGAVCRNTALSAT